MGKTFSFESFRSFYEKNRRCPNQACIPKHELSDKEIRRNFEKYLKQVRRSEIKKERVSTDKKSYVKGSNSDPKWRQVKAEVHKIYGERCFLETRLVQEGRKNDLAILKENAGPFFRELQCAHVIRKTRNQKVYYYLVDDIVLLNAYSHSMLDTFHCPLTGKKITEDEQRAWWIFLVGKEKFSYLESLSAPKEKM